MKKYFLSLIVFLACQAIVPPSCNAMWEDISLNSPLEDKRLTKVKSSDNPHKRTSSFDLLNWEFAQEEEEIKELEIQNEKNYPKFSLEEQIELLKMKKRREEERLYDGYFSNAQKGNVDFFTSLTMVDRYTAKKILSCRRIQSGNTLLHIAALWGRNELVEFFCNNLGLNPHIKNNVNQTPKGLAIQAQKHFKEKTKRFESYKITIQILKKHEKRYKFQSHQKVNRPRIQSEKFPVRPHPVYRKKKKSNSLEALRNSRDKLEEDINDLKFFMESLGRRSPYQKIDDSDYLSKSY